MKLKYFGHSTSDIFLFILPLILPVMLVRYELSYTAAGSILPIILSVLFLLYLWKNSTTAGEVAV